MERILDQLNPSESLLKRPINRVLADNARRVVFVYPVIWFLVGVIGGYFVSADGWAWWLALMGWVVLSVLRYYQLFRISRLGPDLWRKQFTLLTLFQAIAWSAASIFHIFAEVGQEMMYAWVFISFGLVSAAVTYMSAFPFLAFTYQAILLFPLLVALAVSGNSGLQVLFVLGILYWLQMTMLTIQQSRHHRNNLFDRIKLEAYAARLKAVSEHDSLTGLANRRQFDLVFEREWERLSRNGGALALLMLDLDHFKTVNDTYGHVVGDRCLQEIASRLSEHIRRPADLLSRYGGEEFIILLPETTLDGARQVADLLRAAAEESPLVAGKYEIPVTLSVGVACAIPAKGEAREKFIERVDAALYRAKESGRNCVVVDSSVSPDISSQGADYASKP